MPTLPEDRKARRGEPVLYDGRPGTIEWGDDSHGYSLYMEQGGRQQVFLGDVHRVTADPGGSRPVWKRVVPRG